MANFCSGGRDSIHATTRWWVSASANLVEQFGGVPVHGFAGNNF